MFYFITRTYSPNTAPINRVMGWARGLSTCGVDTEFVFFSPSDHFDKVSEEYPHIKFTYMWDRFYIRNQYLKFFSLFLYVTSFVLKLKRGDCVYVYACPDILKWVLKRKHIHVYNEITEHPDVSLCGSRFSKPSTQKFIKDCQELDGLFVISDNLKTYFSSKGIEESKIHVLNMTVDATRFDGLTKQKSERYIAYCGNASNNKDGVDQLIKAFAIISQNHPDVKLYIIGPKPNHPNDFPNLALANELGIANKVVFTGIVNSKDIPQLLKNAEICALDRPDNIQAKYGFPTKLGEYLLTENPVVITDVGNIPQFLHDEVSALVAKPNDPESFAAKMNWVLDNPDKAKCIGIEGAKVARRDFNCVYETEKIVNILNL